MIIIRKQSAAVGTFACLVLAVTIHQSFTTEVPATEAPATSSSPEDPGAPDQGSYTVSNASGTPCLLAKMGLQMNISYASRSQGKTVQEVMNLHPNLTKTSGRCGLDSATLTVNEDNVTLTFTFSLNSTSSKYHLSGLELSASLPDMTEFFLVSNSSLDYLKGSLGHSYMCQKEQTLNVTQDFSLNTFQLQVQPFGVSGDFAAAEQCEMDEDDMLIPIVVGAALAVLVLIVIMAYLIGRNRSHAGYQTI